MDLKSHNGICLWNWLLYLTPAQPTGGYTGSLISKGFFLSGSVTSTGSFGHFNMGDYGGFGTISIISSGYSGLRADQTTHGGKITILDTSELTGLNTEGFISSSRSE